MVFSLGPHVAGVGAKWVDGRFLRDRLLRLGVPVLAAVVVVTPFVVDDRGGHRLPAHAGRVRAVAASVARPGPMWFAAVLLLFTLCYAGLRWVRPARQFKVEQPRIQHLLLAAALIAALSFAIRLAFPVG